MTKLARLIADMEGFNKVGTKPNRFNNPGDLRHSPHSKHTPWESNGIGVIDTVEHGWEDLDRQLHLYAARGLTLESMIYDFYAPPSENNSQTYLDYLCKGLNLPPSTLVSEALKAECPNT